MSDRSPYPLLSQTRRRAIRLLLKLSLRVAGVFTERSLHQLGSRLEDTQADVLRKILAAYRGSVFDKHYRLREIRTVQQFRAQIPIQDYEAIRPWIEREMAGTHGVIRVEKPASYSLTSGTTAQPKLVPIYRTTLAEYRKALNYMMYQGWRHTPEIFDGRMLRLIGHPAEGYATDGLAIGSKSGQMSQNSSKLTQSYYEIPYQVFALPAPLKYLAVLRQCLTWDDLALVITPNPSSVLLLADLMRSHWSELLNDLQTNSFHRSEELPKGLAAHFARLPPVGPDRLRLLRSLPPNPTFSSAFPSLKMVSCWISGSCSIFARALREELLPSVALRDLGYIATEVHATLPHGATGTPGVPLAGSTFFEFAERSTWESSFPSRHQPPLLGLHELQAGKQYYVFVTTADGLLRYAMNDIVEVQGAAFGIPLLGFIQKGIGMTNLVGEKVSEQQVLDAVQLAEQALGVLGRFYFCVADPGSRTYVLYYQPRGDSVARFHEKSFARHFDQLLISANIEYASKRSSGRLAPAQCRSLKLDACDAFQSHCIRAGMREGQFKFVALRNAEEIDFPWDDWVLSAGSDSTSPDSIGSDSNESDPGLEQQNAEQATGRTSTTK